jgi:hypothetical protein
MDHFDILELEAGVLDSRIALGVDMRHVTVVVRVQRTLACVEYEAVSAGSIDGG